MRATVTALLSLLLSGPASAQISLVYEINGFEWRALTDEEYFAYLPFAKRGGYGPTPPERFDYFNSDIEVIGVPEAKIDWVCHAQPSKKRKLAGGCSFPSDTLPCLIILPTDGPFKAALFRHEMAHCNGWPYDHPP